MVAVGVAFEAARAELSELHELRAAGYLILSVEALAVAWCWPRLFPLRRRWRSVDGGGGGGGGGGSRRRQHRSGGGGCSSGSGHRRSSGSNQRGLAASAKAVAAAAKAPAAAPAAAEWGGYSRSRRGSLISSSRRSEDSSECWGSEVSVGLGAGGGMGGRCSEAGRSSAPSSMRSFGGRSSNRAEWVSLSGGGCGGGGRDSDGVSRLEALTEQPKAPIDGKDMRAALLRQQKTRPAARRYARPLLLVLLTLSASYLSTCLLISLSSLGSPPSSPLGSSTGSRGRRGPSGGGGGHPRRGADEAERAGATGKLRLGEAERARQALVDKEAAAERARQQKDKAEKERKEEEQARQAEQEMEQRRKAAAAEKRRGLEEEAETRALAKLRKEEEATAAKAERKAVAAERRAAEAERRAAEAERRAAEAEAERKRAKAREEEAENELRRRREQQQQQQEKEQRVWAEEEAKARAQAEAKEEEERRRREGREARVRAEAKKETTKKWAFSSASASASASTLEQGDSLGSNRSLSNGSTVLRVMPNGDLVLTDDGNTVWAVEGSKKRRVHSVAGWIWRKIRRQQKVERPCAECRLTVAPSGRVELRERQKLLWSAGLDKRKEKRAKKGAAKRAAAGGAGGSPQQYRGQASSGGAGEAFRLVVTNSGNVVFERGGSEVVWKALLDG